MGLEFQYHAAMRRATALPRVTFTMTSPLPNYAILNGITVGSFIAYLITAYELTSAIPPDYVP